MRVLLLGSQGQLGKAIVSLKPKSSKSIELIALSKEDLNLLDINKCRKLIKDINPIWTINCAAYTNVEKAETEKDLARSINAIAPKIIAEELSKQEGLLLHISTDFVFSGKQDIPYKIMQESDPINIYGKTKLEGENYIKQILKGRGKILRTSWLYGPDGKNFLLTMLELFKKQAITNNPIKVVSDQYGCPTSTLSLAKICWKLIFKKEKSYSNILHWSDKGKASWYEFALYISKIAKDFKIINKNPIIQPISSIDYASKVKRPAYSVLDTNYIEKLLNEKNIQWQYNLKVIMDHIVKNKIY